MDLQELQKQTQDLKVLYVEDSMTMRNAVHKILLDYFKHVDVAKDGQEAFELFVSYYDTNSVNYDIVISDLEMPIMDGAELSQKILDFNFTQEIIVTSSVEEFAKLVDLMNLGVNKFISKPIEEQQLSKVIEQVYQNLQIKKLQEQEQLEIQRAEIKRVKKAKEDFFINISHEIKTPLNSILGFSALLKKRLEGDEKSLLMVNAIHETGEELHKLIESMIDLRKLQEHSLELDKVSFCPYDELSRCIDAYVGSAYKKGLNLQSKMDINVAKNLMGDPSRICQVVGILIENAIKFTPEQGKILIHVDYDESLKSLIIEVKDNGIGIAKENQAKIFDMQQLDATANRAYEGAGLGLSIASNLVQIMQGKISLKSISTKGSLFIVELPLQSNL